MVHVFLLFSYVESASFTGLAGEGSRNVRTALPTAAKSSPTGAVSLNRATLVHSTDVHSLLLVLRIGHHALEKFEPCCYLLKV